MFRALPPIKVSSASTSPHNRLNPPSVKAKRKRWAMNHAVFWVTPRSRASSQELMPFLQFTTSHRAGSHLSNPSGDSSKSVPVFKENVGIGCTLKHFKQRVF